MRVLVISQVVFSKTNNTGKTLSSYFRGFNIKEIAQLYFHSEIPTDNTICTRYYRFNDVDALKSVFNRTITGREYTELDIRADVTNSRTDSGITRRAYVAGSKHTPINLVLRDVVWDLSNWKNNCLWKWIEEFKPNVIFFLSGDGAFTYKICQYISRKYSIPFVAVCVDDYYLNDRNKGEFLAKFQHYYFMRIVKRCYSGASSILTICDKMRDEYVPLFEKECNTLHTSAINRKLSISPNAKHVSYIGNVGYKRYEQIIAMGEALGAIDDADIPHVIDVYTGSLNEEYIAPLKQAKGICFHGEIGSDEILKVMEDSIAVIHTESFDQRYRDLTRYSVSTKIAESLMYGPCLIAYGPEGIASIDYLKENHAAYIITRAEDLKTSLKEVLTNPELRKQIVKNARILAEKNHNADVNPKKVRMWLEEIIR